MSAPRDHLPIWPGDEFEIIPEPPHGQTHIVCGQWPHCGCGDDCPHAAANNPAADRVAIGLMALTAIIAGGVLIWSYFI